MKAGYDLKLRSFILAAALLAGLGFVTHAGAQESAYYLIDLDRRTATELESLGADFTYARGFNDAGQVVGYFDDSRGRKHAFITGPNGVGMRELGTLGGSDSSARDINNAGQVVGESNNRAFITGPNGVGMRDLGTLGGNWSMGLGINDAGQVVGSFDAPGEGPPHAFITGPNGVGMRDLGPVEWDFSDALYINNAGQVVGYAYTGNYPLTIFITGPDGVGMRDLGTLGGSFTRPYDINSAGQVVGYSDLLPPSDNRPAGHPDAFITGANGEGMRDLETLGGINSYADGINDAGQVAGSSATATGGQRAFITGPNGEGMTDLNSLVDLPQGTILVSALDINNEGQVIASASVIPEPEIHAMLLAGLGLVGLMTRRKKAESVI